DMSRTGPFERGETMSMSKVDVLIPAPLYPTVKEGLESQFALHLPYEKDDPEAYLREVAPRIRGIATSGSHNPLDKKALARFPNLEIVSNFGVGYDNVDIAEAARRGIFVTNTPDVLSDEVADLAV